MTDKALANAEARRNQLVERKKELLAQITDVDEQIGQIDRFISAWHAFAEDEPQKAVENLSESGVNKTATSQPVKRKATGNSPKEAVAEAALAIIRERREPVSRAALYAELTRRGLKIEGADPDMVLSTMLWRMRDRIVRLPAGGYWDPEQDWPEANFNAVEWRNRFSKEVAEKIAQGDPKATALI